MHLLWTDGKEAKAHTLRVFAFEGCYILYLYGGFYQ